MKKKLIISMLLAVNVLCTFAQHVDVTSDVIDCGQVLFRKPVTAVFELKYKGRSPMKITKVRSGCGCAMVEYPYGKLAQNTDFKVKVTYDSKQMGHFEKKVELFTDNSNKPITLVIKGVVVEELKEDYSGTYPFTLGSVLADKTNIEFDNVNKGDRPQQKIHIINNTSKEVQPVVMHLPSYLLADVSPSRIRPGHSGMIILTLDSHSLRDFGLTQTKVYLGMFPGDKVASDKEIEVSTILLPSLKQDYTTNKSLSPKISLPSTTIDLGSFSGNKKKRGEMFIKNVGKSTLEITNVQMFTMGLQVSLDKTKIKPGGEARMIVTGTAKELLAAKHPRVLMITNDPDNSKVVIEIKSRL